jgi:hypothetical protein
MDTDLIPNSKYGGDPLDFPSEEGDGANRDSFDDGFDAQEIVEESKRNAYASETNFNFQRSGTDFARKI